MYYDLHIHSALSPCSDDDMTLNNIINMALIKGLDLISICDHNSVKQLYNLHKVAQNKINYLYGVEIQTREEVHVLAYFKQNANLNSIQEFLDKHLIQEPNDENYYGHQYVFNELDEIIDIEHNLLIQSIDLNLYNTIDAIHHLGGLVVLAHAMNKRYSIMANYFAIDEDLDIDGIEVNNIKQKNLLIEMFPYLKDILFLYNSDAHQLIDIQEPYYSLDYDELLNLWIKRYG